MNHAALDLLQGELERLYDLDELLSLCAEVLGFAPADVGGTGSKGAFARSLVGYCVNEDALAALVDAILLTSDRADAGLRNALKSASNGELTPGTRVGSLKVVKKLAEGGLAIVYLAEADSGEMAALKVIRSEYAKDRGAVHRFTTASRVMQKLRAPGLAPIVGVGQLPDARPWVAAELITGQGLSDRLKQHGPLHINDARSIFEGVLQGLIALHKRGLVHGDVKAENVFVVARTGSAGTPELSGVLVDAGGERLLSRSQNKVDVTSVLPLIGTPKAMSPEQARGNEPDARSDVYGMGTLMYETLTGRAPFVGDSAIEVIAQQVSATPEPPSAYARRGWVSEALDEIVLRALAKEPHERFPDAASLLEALDHTSRPSKRRPLDELAFAQARNTLVREPHNENAADLVENQARDSGAWDRAATVFAEAARGAGEESVRLSLLFRAARIYESELKNPLRAEAIYQQINDLDPGNEIALRGVEAARRNAGDYTGLLEILLDRSERERAPDVRTGLLHEIAALYEEKLLDANNAAVAYTQALVHDPSDTRALRAIERLTAGNDGRMSDVLGTLTSACEQAHAQLFGDDQISRKRAVEELEAAKTALAAAQARANDSAEARLITDQDVERAAQAETEQLEQRLRSLQGELTGSEAKREVNVQRVREAEETVQDKRTAHEASAAEAEATVERFEGLREKYGETPSEEQNDELAALAASAEELVDRTTQLEKELEQALLDLANIETELSQSDDAVAGARSRYAAADDALQRARGEGAELVDDESVVALTLEEDEGAALTEAEARVAAAERELARFGSDESERASLRKRELAQLVQLYVIMGRFYVTRLNRADYALSCFSRALEVDPDNDAAYDATLDVYRNSQAYTELASALLARADRSQNPVRARDYRAQAAVIFAHKLGDEPKARTQLERVLEDDPAHVLAHDTLAGLFAAQNDYKSLAALIERRLAALEGDAKLEPRLKLAELYENQLRDPERAEAHYLAVSEAAPRKLDAWKGLERIYAQQQNYEGLLNALRAQVDLAPTPRQRIALFERIGTLLEEEFVNHEAATEAFAQITAIDASHELANTGLARLYRQLSRFDDVVDTLQRLAASTRDAKHKVGLLLQVVRTYNVDIGSPERAMAVCERILEIDPEEPEALSEMARLKSIAGDVASAVAAVERLAAHEHDPRKQAEQYIRAARLLEEHGDRDGAIGRYKKALDADRNALPAVDGLRAIYARRGDAHGAIEMLNHAISLTEGDRKRAELYAELGSLHADKLDDILRAEQAFNTALSLDATCTVALVGLGRIEHARANYDQAAGYLSAVFGRLDELPKRDAAQVCALAAESYRSLGQLDKATDAYKRARDFIPDDLETNERYAAIVRESGDAKAAERLYERMYTRFEDELDMSERLRLLRAWGDAQLDAGLISQAVATFKEALARRPDDEAALDGLTRAYTESGAYQEVINLLQLRSRSTSDPELRFRLLVETGDVFLEKVKDRDAAAQTYVMALDQQPHNRNLLSKLMAVYSDAQDWSRLIEVILRIAEMVDSDEQLAKYYNTAANIAQKELGRYDEAANYYELALSHLPPESGQAQLDGLVRCLTENQDWERLDRAYETRISRLHEAKAPVSEIAAVLDARGRVLAEQLGRTSEALELYEQAQTIDPDNRERREMLTAVYTKEPKRYFVRAVASHRTLLSEDPYRVDSLQALRRIYTSGKRPDESWCLCQALRCLQMADVDEEKFFKKYRLSSLPRAKRVLDEELYRAYVWHPLQDPSLTAIFAALSPAIAATQSQPLTAFGVDPRSYADPASDPTPMARMLHHVAEMTGMHLPEVYHCPNDAGGLSFLFALPPAIGIGMGARASGPQQALAFVAARHVSYYRPGHYTRQLVPTGTGLRTWLFASIRLVSPNFPIPAQMELVTKECVEAIRTQLTGPQRDALRSMTQKLLEAAPELDMKSWMAGVDLSADRLGLLLGNDLKIANAVIEASPEDAAVISKRDRLRELLVYSVSESYFELRKALGIALGG